MYAFTQCVVPLMCGVDIGALACTCRDAAAAVDWEAIKANYRPGAIKVSPCARGGPGLDLAERRVSFGLDRLDIPPGRRVSIRDAVGVALLKHGGVRGLRAFVDSTPRGKRDIRIRELGPVPDTREVRRAIDLYRRSGGYGYGLERVRSVIDRSRAFHLALDACPDPEVRRVGLDLWNAVSYPIEVSSTVSVTRTVFTRTVTGDVPGTVHACLFCDTLRRHAAIDLNFSAWSDKSPDQVVARARAIVEAPARAARALESAGVEVAPDSVSAIARHAFESDEECDAYVLGRVRRHADLVRATAAHGDVVVDPAAWRRYLELAEPADVDVLVEDAVEVAWMRANAYAKYKRELRRGRVQEKDGIPWRVRAKRSAFQDWYIHAACLDARLGCGLPPYPASFQALMDGQFRARVDVAVAAIRSRADLESQDQDQGQGQGFFCFEGFPPTP